MCPVDVEMFPGVDTPLKRCSHSAEDKKLLDAIETIGQAVRAGDQWSISL